MNSLSPTEALHHLKKLRRHERDRLTEARRKELDELIEQLEEIPRDAEDFSKQVLVEKAEKLYGQLASPEKRSHLAENLDVLIVAIVVALGIRTYFLQPFKIPTNSMYPTLRGVVVTPQASDQPQPTQWQRWIERLFLGRAYVDFTIPANAVFKGQKSSGFFWLRKLTLFFNQYGQEIKINLYCEAEFSDIVMSFGLIPYLQMPSSSDVSFKGIVDTGDHLFVDKLTYHFRRPEKGDAFVFRTAGLPTQYNLEQGNQAEKGSQFYIKRCVAVGDDSIQVKPPKLYINGEAAQDSRIQRVWLDSDPRYKGYSHGSSDGSVMNYLRTSDETFKMPKNTFWAMGDNSYNSADSRQFGPVPLQNIVGKALIIYYPFNRKFWLIK